jgi:hypothetical protein
MILFAYWGLQLVVPYMVQLLIMPVGERSLQLLTLTFITATVLFALEIVQLINNGFKSYFS